MQWNFKYPTIEDPTSPQEQHISTVPIQVYPENIPQIQQCGGGQTVSGGAIPQIESF